MSDIGSDTESESDLEALTRRAAEAKLLDGISCRGEDVSSENEDKDTEDTSLSSPQRDLLHAAEHGDLAAVRRLLHDDPALVSVRDKDGYSPLHRAVYNNHVEVAAALLSAGASLTARTGEGWTPLHSAVRWNAVACARLLLRRGADLNAVTSGGLTPLMVAASATEARDTAFLLLTTPGVQLHLTNAGGETAADIGRRNVAVAPLLELTANYLTDI